MITSDYAMRYTRQSCSTGFLAVYSVTTCYPDINSRRLPIIRIESRRNTANILPLPTISSLKFESLAYIY